ncbi:wsc protein [Fusarium austroafricanum]|uniref:Wsc protein n=1 Tax=Fusarium austroafricanum TaxID=2364996 RepID=A0A8H4KA62_9HYPO|nr:wsc protein [Fusarium austroafricanum]
MHLLILLSMLLLTAALPHSPTSKHIGCTSKSATFSPISLSSPFTAPQCLQACVGKATLVAIGGGSCYCDKGGASASFELVDEARCDAFCIAGDESSGKCGGDEVLSLYQIEACDGRAKNATVPPVVPPSPCALCEQPSTLIPTIPTPQAQQKAPIPCPPEGCQSAPAPIATPARNSTAKTCPSGGCNANEEGGSQSGNQGGSHGGDQSSNQGGDRSGSQGGSQGGTAPTPNGSSGGGSKAAPKLASESPRLYTPSILSAIAAVIFGFALL